MVYPAIKLHQLYSLNLYEGLDIIFEDLSMLNTEELERVIKTKELGHISIVNFILSVNTNDKTIKLIGNKINDSTYIINRNGGGDIILLSYKCEDNNILTAIEYLYHMYKNLV
jgi:tryptophan synthase alpha subunit